MSYTRVRERDERTNQLYSLFTRTETGQPYGVGWKFHSAAKNPYKTLGTKQVVFDNVTSLWAKKNRPVVVINPCCMYKISGLGRCTDLTYISPYKNRPDLPSRRIDGRSDWFSGMFNIEATWPQYPLDIDKRIQEIISQQACAKKHEPPVDLGLFMREANMTLQMLIDPFKTLKDALNTLVHKSVAVKGGRGIRFGLDRSAASRLSDAWLQYRYGIIPLMLDIDAGVAAYENLVVKPPRSRLERSTEGMLVANSTKIERTRQTHPTGWFNLGLTKTVKEKTFATGHVYWIRKFPAQATYGGGFNDLASFLWETIPYSFCVDWVFSVGNWLRSIQPDESIDYAGNCVSMKTVIETEWMNTDGYETTIGAPIIPNGSTTTVREERLVRVSNTPIPLTPVFVGDRFSLARSVDALSLIWQRMPKLIRGK